ncbi:hypothetical protein H0H92_013990, partial [Tricholoma furcatifolium]
IIAILLGRLRLSTEEAITEYIWLAMKVFSHRKCPWQDGSFKASTLTAAIQELVSRHDVEGTCMMDKRSPTNECKTFVCAMPALNASHARLFRSYTVKQNSGYNAEIWEAVRATSAAPMFFKRIFVGSEPQEEFIDGGLRVNNPVSEVLQEAKTIWGDNYPIKCIINIGTGHSETIKLEKPMGIQKVLPTKFAKMLHQIALDCEKTAEDFEKKYRDQHLYYRLSVQHGLEK